jgi:predicted alpha/beta hydrolase
MDKTCKQCGKKGLGKEERSGHLSGTVYVRRWCRYCRKLDLRIEDPAPRPAGK